MNTYTVEELVNILIEWVDQWERDLDIVRIPIWNAYAYLAGYAPEASMRDCHEAVKKLVNMGKLHYIVA